MYIKLLLGKTTRKFAVEVLEAAFEFLDKYEKADINLGPDNYHVYWKPNCEVRVYKTLRGIVARPVIDIYDIKPIDKKDTT